MKNKAKWIPYPNDGFMCSCYCSNCMNLFLLSENEAFDYCPFCGAEMETNND